MSLYIFHLPPGLHALPFCLFAVVKRVYRHCVCVLVCIFALIVNFFVCADFVSLGSHSLCSWPLRLMCVLYLLREVLMALNSSV